MQSVQQEVLSKQKPESCGYVLTCISTLVYEYIFTIVAGVRPPTNLRLSADSDDPTQTALSWTTSRDSGVTGYRIYYKALGSTFSRSADVGANQSKHSFLLQRGFVYNITMVTRSLYLPSTVSTLISATLGKNNVVVCH